MPPHGGSPFGSIGVGINDFGRHISCSPPGGLFLNDGDRDLDLLLTVTDLINGDSDLQCPPPLPRGVPLLLFITAHIS